MRLFYFLVFVTLFGCSTTQDLLGPIELRQLKQKPHSKWFLAEYDYYQPATEPIEQLKTLLKDVHIKVFMGTWCSDSHMQVPAFFKVLDAVTASDNVAIIAVNEDKKTPSGSASKNGITHVPTFIFYKNGVEITRIVESPVDFLETDMLAILSGTAYKHTYQN